jgi:hypothetical protein
MPSGTGYISDWIVDDVGGIIHVCSGDHLVGDDVAFPFDECSSALKDLLEQGSISEEIDCPPPDTAVRVKFDFDVFEDDDLAINVRLD